MGRKHLAAGCRLGRAAAAVLIAAALLAACANEPAEQVVEIVVQDGAIVGGAGSISARQGDAVTLLIDSDADATLHAHGLPDVVAVRAGEPARIELDTTYVGQFDVELHLISAGPAAMAGDRDSGAAMEAGAMSHGGAVPAPSEMSVAITLTPDSVDGLNLQISTTGFKWSPEGAGGEHVAGEGHAHVYVDGVKRARAYGPWLHLSALDPGTRHVRVTLNGNAHGEYVREGQPVAAEASAEVPESSSGGGHGAAAVIVAELSVAPS